MAYVSANSRLFMVDNSTNNYYIISSIKKIHFFGIRLVLKAILVYNKYIGFKLSSSNKYDE